MSRNLQSLTNFFPLISAYIISSECFGSCSGNALFWLKKKSWFLMEVLTLARIFRCFSLCRLPMISVSLDYLANWINQQSKNNIHEYKNSWSWKKINRKKNYLAVGALYLLKVPAGGADNDHEVCCRSPSILRLSLTSSLLSSKNWNFPLTSGNSVTSSSPYRLMKVKLRKKANKKHMYLNNRPILLSQRGSWNSLS